MLERLERELDRRVELDQADRRPHDLGDVGLQGVGVAEDAVEECVLVDAADELRDVDPASRTTGACEMLYSCRTSIAWRTLSARSR